MGEGEEEGKEEVEEEVEVGSWARGSPAQGRRPRPWTGSGRVRTSPGSHSHRTRLGGTCVYRNMYEVRPGLLKGGVTAEYNGGRARRTKVWPKTSDLEDRGSGWSAGRTGPYSSKRDLLVLEEVVICGRPEPEQKLVFQARRTQGEGQLWLCVSFRAISDSPQPQGCLTKGLAKASQSLVPVRDGSHRETHRKGTGTRRRQQRCPLWRS